MFLPTVTKNGPELEIIRLFSRLTIHRKIKFRVLLHLFTRSVFIVKANIYEQVTEFAQEATSRLTIASIKQI